MSKHKRKRRVAAMKVKLTLSKIMGRVIRQHSGQLARNVQQNNALLERLRRPNAGVPGALGGYLVGQR
jgi:hypothetical protein